MMNHNKYHPVVSSASNGVIVQVKFKDLKISYIIFNTCVLLIILVFKSVYTQTT